MTSWRTVIITFGVLATCSIAAPLASQGGHLAPALWSSTSPNGHGFEHINRYRDNLDYIVERRSAPQFAPIGELETRAEYRDAQGNPQRWYGTAVIVSPCYALTAYHNFFFGPGDHPVPGRDYSQLMRVGVSSNPHTMFLGNTVVTPVSWGGLGDWMLIKMKTCVGAFKNIGWMEFSNQPISDLVGAEIGAAGFSGTNKRGVLVFSTGKVTKEILPEAVLHSASISAGQSGGPVMVRENGKIRIIGMITSDFSNEADPTREGELYDTYYGSWNGQSWAGPKNVNVFTPLGPICGNCGFAQGDAKWRDLTKMVLVDGASILSHVPEFGSNKRMDPRMVPWIIIADRARFAYNPAETHMAASWPQPVNGTPQPY